MPETDALVTDLDTAVLGIFTADCLPALFVDEDKGVCGAVHAGWRGSQQKILLAALNLTMQKWQLNAERVKVHIGPHIRPCCYEVGPEVAAQFPENCVVSRGGKAFLDLAQANALQLAEAGVPAGNITVDYSCTKCDKRFFSYRRDRTENRMLNFIGKTGIYE